MFQDSLTKKIAQEASKIKTEIEEIEVNEKSVEGSASKIMKEGLKGNQHKIDANKNGKVDAQDFAILRGKKKVEEAQDTPGNSYQHQCALHVKSEQFGEGKTLFSQHAEPDTDGNIAWYDVMFEHGIEKEVPTATLEILVSESHGNHKKMKKEEVEELDEVKMADLPSRKVQGKSYGASKKQGNAFDVLKGPKDKDLKSIEKDEKKMVPDWARGHNESTEEESKKVTFSEMLKVYQESGVKALNEWSKKEIEEEKSELKEEVEQIEEREMTDAEMAKREEIVKSMKKGMKGFKDRYGDRAKNVMYATATKQAMKD